METGDGFVLRIKPSGGLLSLPHAKALASLALTYGNGRLDLTARANLQIRGVQAHAIAPLTDRLGDLGLVDADPEIEAVRNVVLSPLYGADPGITPSLQGLAQALEARIACDPMFRHLPAKWNFVIDGGGRLPLGGITGDLRFEVDQAGAVQVGLGSDSHRAAVPAGELVESAAALCRLALEPEPRRMKVLLRERSAVDLFAAAGLATFCTPAHQPVATRPDAVGIHRLGRANYLGVAAAFGDLSARDLLTLSIEAPACGARDLRLTPWRTLLMTGLSQDGAAQLAQRLATTHLIFSADDPRLAIAACSGAPACHRGSTPVREDATALAALLSVSRRDGMALHVSGCAKGCAHPEIAPWTLVGREGAYDLVRNGMAGDEPLVRGLSFQEAAGWLSRSPGEEPL